MINILVTGAGGGVGQGIIKSLRLIKDLEINIIASDMSSLASGLYSGDYCHLLPSASDEKYFDEVANICAKHKIDYYFPGTDVELMVCANEAQKLKDKLGTNIIISSLNVIEIADDKYKTINFLKKNNFSYPLTWLPSEIDLNTINYPVIVKPRIGCRSIGVHLVSTPLEAQIAIESLHNPIIQEYINGEEFTCTVAIRKGNVSDVLCLKRDLRAGDTYRAFPERNDIIEKYVKSIALTLELNSSCNFQLRTDNGIPKLFEINARFSGTTPFCAYLGFNPVEFCLKQDLGLTYQSNIKYENAVLRHWCEVVISKDQLELITEQREGRFSSVIVSSML